MLCALLELEVHFSEDEQDTDNGPCILVAYCDVETIWRHNTTAQTVSLITQPTRKPT